MRHENEPQNQKNATCPHFGTSFAIKHIKSINNTMNNTTQNIRKQITVKPDQSESYFSAKSALEDNGFEFEADFYGEKNPVNRKTKKYSVYLHKSSGNYYYFDNMDHFNTTIYSIFMRLLPNPIGHYYRY